MSQTIVKTRVIPKKITENIVSRGRLLKKFEENASKNIILVMGPAGYGKTTSVLDFLAGSGRKYAWLYISPDIDSIASFMSYLIHSVKVLKSDFGENTLELVNSFAESDLFTKDEANSISSVTSSFVNEFFTDFTDDIFIVIDDLHNIEGSGWLNPLFNSLIDNFPDNLHMIITSRSVPGFNMAKLTAKRKLAKIDASDLNFTSDETESLLKDIYSITYKKEDVRGLLGKIEGWITGLHLILQAYGIDFPKITSGKQMVDADIFSYFAEDIYGQLDEATQNFICTTSMLDAFTPEVCEEVLGITGSKGILDELKRKNLFIETTAHISENGTEVTTYSYHNLFKQFLITRLHETRSKDEIKALAEKIFQYYLATGDYIQAIEFSLQAGDYTKASELVLSNFETMFQAGRYETIRRWIEQFPADIIEKNYEMLYIKGKLINFFKSDTEKAFEIFTEIIKNAPRSTKLYIKANSEISEIMRHTGRPEEALNIFKELYKLDTGPELKISIIISLAKSYYRLGSKYYDEILKLLSEAEELSGANGLTESIPDIYSLYGRVYLNKGEFVKSLHYFESNYRKESNIYRRFQAINDIVLLHSWSGDYNKAKEYYDESEAIFKKYNILHFERDLLRLNALLRFEAGDYEAAIEAFKKLSNIDKSNKLTSFILTYNLIISEAYMLMGEYSHAGEYLQIADKFKDSKDELLKPEFDYHKALVEKNNVINSKVEKILLQTLKQYESTRSDYDISQVQFQLADFYYKKGEIDSSKNYLNNSLKTASNNSYNSFLIQQFIEKRYLFDLAVNEKIESDFVKHLKNLVSERNKFVWLSDKCKSRIDLDNDALYDISILTFGGTEIQVRGKITTDDVWIRKKSKLLLIYLLVNQGLKIQKDKVLGVFFSELSADSADNIFHQAITNIRNVLKPASPLPVNEDAKSKKAGKKESAKTDVSPSYIVYEDKILQMATGFDFKVDVLEFNKLASIVKSRETDEPVKEEKARLAIDMYKGEFLPGYYDEWVEELRSILEHKYIETGEELLSILKKKRNYDDLALYSEKILLSDKLHEEASYCLILAYKELGNITMAKKKLSQLLKNYEEEYGEKPPKELLAKIDLILNI